jgi:3-oxoacyl-[acyl-carrier protein] reductase
MGAQGEIICADVSKKEEVDAIFSSYPKIDILINNAGISYEAPLQDMSESDWDHVMDVCQKSVFLCTKAALPAMISQKEGVIINISSMWGICGASCEVAYSTAKAGVIGFTRALAKEVGPSNIRVNAIAPGVIDTDMNACYTKEDLAVLCDATPLGRMGTPMEIAQSALFLAEHPFITGEILNVSGGFLI